MCVGAIVAFLGTRTNVYETAGRDISSVGRVRLRAAAIERIGVQIISLPLFALICWVIIESMQIGRCVPGDNGIESESGLP